MGRAHAFETDRGDQLTDAREACAHIVRQRTQFRVRRFVEGLDGPCHVPSVYRISAMRATAESPARDGLHELTAVAQQDNRHQAPAHL